ncbi:hypothetical protein MRX96_029527 [Rhipicephalus microplus]
MAASCKIGTADCVAATPLSPPHRVAVTLEQNDVTEALCTCKAGSYKCGHVVAVLLHLHTQQLLAQPSVQCQGPRVSVKKEKQNKKNESKEKLDLPCIDKLTIDDAPAVADISRRPLENSLHKSTSPVPTKHASECAQGRQQSKEDSEPAPKTLKAAIHAIAHTAKQAKNKPSVEEIFKKLCKQHNPDDVKIVERATREQSCCELWLEHRVGMITASVAYSVFTRVNTIRTKAGPPRLAGFTQVAHERISRDERGHAEGHHSGASGERGIQEPKHASQRPSASRLRPFHSSG